MQSASHITFLGLAEPAAKDVVCLLDSQLNNEAGLEVPAADGSESISMSGADIEKFLG